MRLLTVVREIELSGGRVTLLYSAKPFKLQPYVVRLLLDSWTVPGATVGAEETFVTEAAAVQSYDRIVTAFGDPLRKAAFIKSVCESNA